MGKPGRGDGVDLTEDDRTRIKERLTVLGWSHGDLATRVGRTRTYITKVLSTGRIGRGTLKLIADALDLEFPDLLSFNRQATAR